MKKMVTTAASAMRVVCSFRQRAPIVAAGKHAKQAPSASSSVANAAHQRARAALADPEKVLVLLEGPSGVGKTFSACQAAADLLLLDTPAARRMRVRLVRPCVAVDGEEHGFLPGDIQAKMAPWMLPVIDHLESLLSPAIVAGAIRDGRLTFEPISHMRGRSFQDSFIIADEMQNATRQQTLTLLSRVGMGSRIVVTGDLMQSDLGPDNGLHDLLNRLYRFDASCVHLTRFASEHIKRSPFVGHVIEAYNTRFV